MSAYAKLNLSGLRDVIASLDDVADEVARTIGVAILEEAMESVPVDTGALKNSGYLESNKDSQRDLAESNALKRRWSKKRKRRVGPPRIVIAKG